MRLEKPRVAPLADAEIDPELRERLGERTRSSTSSARSPTTRSSLKRWLVFGNHVLARNTLRAARARAGDPAHRLAVPLRLRVGPARAHREATRA